MLIILGMLCGTNFNGWPSVNHNKPLKKELIFVANFLMDLIEFSIDIIDLLNCKGYLSDVHGRQTWAKSKLQDKTIFQLRKSTTNETVVLIHSPDKLIKKLPF